MALSHNLSPSPISGIPSHCLFLDPSLWLPLTASLSKPISGIPSHCLFLDHSPWLPLTTPLRTHHWDSLSLPLSGPISMAPSHSLSLHPSLRLPLIASFWTTLHGSLSQPFSPGLFLLYDSLELSLWFHLTFPLWTPICRSFSELLS